MHTRFIATPPPVGFDSVDRFRSGPAAGLEPRVVGLRLACGRAKLAESASGGRWGDRSGTPDPPRLSSGIHSSRPAGDVRRQAGTHVRLELNVGLLYDSVAYVGKTIIK